jgi:hypothetical protein
MKEKKSNHILIFLRMSRMNIVAIKIIKIKIIIFKTWILIKVIKEIIYLKLTIIQIYI